MGTIFCKEVVTQCTGQVKFAVWIIFGLTNQGVLDRMEGNTSTLTEIS